MKRPPDETIVIFAFVAMIFYFMTAELYLRIVGSTTDNETFFQVLHLLIGVVSGWMGRGINDKRKRNGN